MKRSYIKRVSAKKAARYRSPEGIAEAIYLEAVRSLPCAACGRVGATEAHHCRDTPPHAEWGLYDRLPCAGRKSADRDAIPLCGPDGCHKMYHLERAQFHADHGPDYQYITQTRAEIEPMELDY